MWKDWLHFSGRERNGIYTLLVLMFLLTAMNFIIPKIVQPKTYDFSEYSAILDSIDTLLKQPQFAIDHPEDHFVEDSLLTFDPNTVDSAQLRSLGFGLKSTQQLLSYRLKGGQFRIKQDVSKLYAIEANEYAMLKPFLDLPDSFPKSKKKNRQGHEFQNAPYKPTKKKYYQKKKPLLELNTADTADLRKLYGIGPTYASRIVKYRNLLGGYAYKEQLLEVYGLMEETFELINEFIFVDTGRVQKIHINSYSVSRLKSHPYINFYQAKAIYVYRKDSVIQDFDEVLAIQNLDTTGFYRLHHYFSYQVAESDSSLNE